LKHALLLFSLLPIYFMDNECKSTLESVLRAEVGRMCRLDLAVRFLLLFGFLQGEKLLFSHDEVSCAARASGALRRLRKVSKS